MAAHVHPRQEPLTSSDASFRLLVTSVKDYAIILIDLEGRVASWNAGAERISGYLAEEIVGQSFARFYPLEAIARSLPEHELELAASDGHYETQGWRIRKDGSRFWAHGVLTPLFSEDNKLVGYANITRDLTEQRRAEESLQRSEELFRMLVDGIKDYAIIMLDLEGRILSWNRGAELMTGYTEDQIRGQPSSRLYPDEAVARGWPVHELQVARAEGRFENEGWRIRKDGTPFWANVVVTALYDGEGRLRGYAQVTRDLTHHKPCESLEETNRRMHRFLAALAHELRNPLAPIRNAMGVLRMQESKDPRSAWCRDIVDRQVAQLTRLVEDLLDVSRITSGKVVLTKGPLDIAVIVSRAVEASRPLRDERKQDLKVELHDQPLWVLGDLTRLSQVVLNLLNNASKFTPEGGSIFFTARRRDSYIELVVRDSGIGIPKEVLPTIFDLFGQADTLPERSIGGLGLGLALVKEIVNLHGGSVDVTSPGANMGNEFKVRLPSLEDKQPSAAERSDGLRSVATRAPLRILVVDDNPDAAESMSVLLQLAGHIVRSVHDGPAALGAARELQPDVVLLDIGLPGMTGYEVAEQLRQMPWTRRPILVAMTGYGQEEDLQRARAAGFDHHLVKPVNFEALSRILQGSV